MSGKEQEIIYEEKRCGIFVKRNANTDTFNTPILFNNLLTLVFLCGFRFTLTFFILLSGICKFAFAYS